MTYDEILFAVERGVARVTLNRPKALNALTLDKVRRLDSALRVWADDPDVRLVVIEGTGERAFCAGGDVRAVATAVKEGRTSENDAFFKEEYRLNALIKTYPKPYVALIDGVAMGGGLGVSVHGPYRVATERTVVAMPETGIGMIPDVGGSWFLPRCPGEIGTWMALTGAHLNAADALHAGIATHYVPSQRLDALKAALQEGGDVETVLAAFHEVPGPSPLAAHRPVIDACFQGDSVEAILAALSGTGDAWAEAAREKIEQKSPTALKAALRQLRLGRTLTFEECLALEYRLSTRITRLPDFVEGIRAVLVDKDNAPHWTPRTLLEVQPSALDLLFSS